MVTLKNYFTLRGIILSGEGSRNADIIRKVFAADLLDYQTLPSQEEKNHVTNVEFNNISD